MQKILNYIINGQGLGLKFLILLAFVMSLFLAVMLKVKGADFVPYAQQVADQMLPIKIENGVVTKPYNTFKQANITFNNYVKPISIPMFIDTRVDNLDTSDVKEGVYLTRTAFYTVKKNDVRIMQLSGDNEILKADYTDTFNSFLTWCAVIFGVMALCGLFMMYFVLALFYSLCAKIIIWLTSHKLDFDQRMRLSSLTIVITYILFLPINWMGGDSKLAFFIVIMALQAYLIKKMPVQVTEEVKTLEPLDTPKNQEPLQKLATKEIKKPIKKTTKKVVKAKKKAPISAKKELAKPSKTK